MDDCEECGDEEGPYCDGCDCCWTCCTCTESDCDCGVCKSRRDMVKNGF